MEKYSKKQKILIVDDEPNMVKLIERIVKGRTSYDVATCVNSLEVPKLLENNEFDLIISDCKMPGMNGTDLLRYLQKEKRFEKVIMCTAFGSFDHFSEVMSLGAFDYITKPFRKAQIIFSVNRAMTYQRLLRQEEYVDRMFAVENWEKSSLLFRREYIKRLSFDETDPGKLSLLSGIPENIIAEELKIIAQNK
ncbi:MAG: response regulator [Chlorobi bacterium]|nr:response regulator [Chlorobiota bacterium]